MMDKKARINSELFGALCGPLYIIFMGIGLWAIAGFFPSQPPMWGAEQIASIFREDYIYIRLGFCIQVVAAFFYCGFTGIISKVLYRIEGSGSWLAFANAVAGCVNVIFTTFPAVIWILAAFRPERDAELIYLLNDMAWLEFLGTAFPVFFQYVCITIASLSDKDPEPLLPRWLGYFNIWTFLGFIPLETIFFFKSGPFAWNGLFSFYLPFIIFFFWFMTLYYCLRKAIFKMAERDERTKTLS